MNKKIKVILLKIHSLIILKRNKLKLGKKSQIQLGYTIEGGKYITVGYNSFIGKNAWLGCFDNVLNEQYQPSIQIGNEVSIGKYSCITSINLIKISDGCLISEYFYVSDHTHGFNPSLGIPPLKQKLVSKGPVLIGENCFIGYGVTISPNVVIGKNCVIGSHSVVTKNIPDYSMVAGVPAKVIKKFNFQLNDWIKVTD
jgi:acetyltransferase-like isoleucine patch superfamily enzyme